MKNNIDHYAVMGNPISHSKSPQIHTAFAQQTNQSLQYDAILVGTQIGDFVQAVRTFQQTGGKGLNITVPFKQEAWNLSDIRHERAELAEAANILWFDENGKLVVDNTDGIGLVRDLTHNHNYQIKGKRVLILGAGGAVRGILVPLLETNPAQCVIVNRTISKAKTLVKLFANFGNVTLSTYDALNKQSFDLIINGTSASLHDEMPALPDNLINTNSCCYDMMYASIPTPFLKWAKRAGLAVDGLGMLVEQAAESFCLWRGVKPDTAPVIQQIREQLT